MSVDFCLDFETLGKDHDCVVLSFSILGFDPFKDDYTFEELVPMVKTWKIDIKQQIKDGRTISKDTLEWWKNQTEEVQKVLEPSDSDTPPSVFIEELHQYLESFDRSYTTLVYCRGTDFDLPILRDLVGKYSEYDKYDFLTKFWNIRDIRSLLCGRLDNNLSTTFLKEQDIPGFIKHNSAHDVAKAVFELQESRKFINT